MDTSIDFLRQFTSSAKPEPALTAPDLPGLALVRCQAGGWQEAQTLALVSIARSLSILAASVDTERETAPAAAECIDPAFKEV